MLEMQARPPRSEIVFEFKALHLARDSLVKDRTASKNLGKVLTLSLLKRQNGQRLDHIARQITKVETAMRDIDADVTGRLYNGRPRCGSAADGLRPKPSGVAIDSVVYNLGSASSVAG